MLSSRRPVFSLVVFAPMLALIACGGKDSHAPPVHERNVSAASFAAVSPAYVNAEGEVVRLDAQNKSYSWSSRLTLDPQATASLQTLRVSSASCRVREEGSLEFVERDYAQRSITSMELTAKSRQVVGAIEASIASNRTTIQAGEPAYDVLQTACLDNYRRENARLSWNSRELDRHDGRQLILRSGEIHGSIASRTFFAFDGENGAIDVTESVWPVLVGHASGEFLYSQTSDSTDLNPWMQIADVTFNQRASSVVIETRAFRASGPRCTARELLHVKRIRLLTEPERARLALRNDSASPNFALELVRVSTGERSIDSDECARARLRKPLSLIVPDAAGADILYVGMNWSYTTLLDPVASWMLRLRRESLTP